MNFLRGAVACLLILTAEAATAAPVSESLHVGGAVKTSLTLKPEDLGAFHAEAITSITLAGGAGEKNRGSTVRGVRLSAILERAGVVSTDRNDWKHMIVIASATDDYRVTFSWPELINTEIGAGVLVIFERNGQHLGDSEGRLALISARDLRTGPRHVKWLNRIELRLM